jgi:hypothetical protein
MTDDGLALEIEAIVLEIRAYPHIFCEFHSGDREPGTRAEGVARTKVDEWADRLAVLSRRSPQPRFTVHPPAWREHGWPPAETTHPCLYTHVRPCKEDWPDDCDQWCGYCLGILTATEVGARSLPPEQEQEKP